MVSSSSSFSSSFMASKQGPTGTQCPPATRHFFIPYLVKFIKNQVTQNIGYYLKYPRYTQKYPSVNKVLRNTWSNISTLLPNLNPHATHLFFKTQTKLARYWKIPTRWDLRPRLAKKVKDSVLYAASGVTIFILFAFALCACCVCYRRCLNQIWH